MQLRGRTALVTGAGRRVGRALAVALGGRGMRVAVHYHAAKEGAAETLRAIQSAGGSGATFAADLAQPDAPAALMADVIAQFGTLDVVVNSAAVMHRTPFASVTPAQWDDIMALNFRAPFFVAQAAAPHLRRADGGR